MKKALFFDRDGTIIVDKNYLFKPEDLEYFPKTFEVLGRVQSLGYLTFLVTNQSGVSRGYFTVSDVEKVHQKIQQDLLNHKLRPFDAIVFCPHQDSDQCICRKPKPGLIHQICQKWPIDLKNSWMVGDKESDYQTGINSGMKSLLIKQNIEEIFNSDIFLAS